jgi:hypothetical protein
MADGINSTWRTPSASKKMNIITFPADWQTLNFLLLQTLSVSTAFQLLLRSIEWNGACKCHWLLTHIPLSTTEDVKKPPNSDFYALLSHIRYTMCMHVAISMLFMDMVLTIVTENSSVADTQFFWFSNHTCNCLFHIHLHSTHIIPSIYLTTVFCKCVTSKQVTQSAYKKERPHSPSDQRACKRPDWFLLSFILSTPI